VCRISALVASLASIAAADPWPMFRGDPQRTGRASFVGPSRGRIVWKAPLGAPVRSSPAVTASARVIVGSDAGSLHVFDAKDGRGVAKLLLGGRIWAGPLVRNGRVFVGSDDQHFYALDFDGDRLALAWKRKSGDFIYGSAAPLGDDAVFGSWDGGLYRLAREDGTRRWRYGRRGDIESSPAISLDGTRIYAGSRDRKLHAVDARRGRVVWKHRAKDSVNSTPAVADDGTIFVGSDDARLYALSASGKKKWAFAADADVVSSPALSPDGRTVYVGSHDGHLYAVRAKDGSLRWKFACDVVWSSPAVDSRGVVYFGAWDGAVYALAPDGAVRFRVSTGAPVWSSPALGPARLYIGSNDGYVYAIE
jgi:outer membrane protein assembly factor BamB